MEIKELNKELVHSANSASFNGTRGNTSEQSYKCYAEKILDFPVSDEKKQKLLDKLYEKWSKLLSYEAQHVSVMAAGPSKYNAKKLDKSDQILKMYAEIGEWFDNLEKQMSQGQLEDNKVQHLLEMIEFCRRPDNIYTPTNDLVKLAAYDNKKFIELYEELYPTYKWRKNSTIAKLYAQSIAGEVKEIKKEVFFEDENFTAYIEGDRAYIKFIMKPMRQLIVALKSRGWWWNSRKNAWSTYLSKLDKEWVQSISKRYSKYI